MAVLVPTNFDLKSLPAESEQETIISLMRKLGNDWIIVPTVPILVNGKDFEIDVVLVSRDLGAFVLEVKGGKISRRDGNWYQYEKKLKKNPFTQIIEAKHALVQRMKQLRIDLDDIYINHIVVMPLLGDIPLDGLGPEAPRNNCWSRVDLEDPLPALARLGRQKQPVPKERLVSFVRALRPTLDISLVDGQFHQSATKRLDEATEAHLEALAGLMENPRFLVTGAAGTGKTILAKRWARSTAARGEQTLLACFNKPLAIELGDEFGDSGVVVSNFHRLAREVLEPNGFSIPAGADSEWWNEEPAKMIIDRAAQIEQKFDAIIVDEAQDFRPNWIAALEALHREDGPRRLLMVADPLQSIYGAGWAPPPGIPTLSLLTNLRSSRAVGRHVRDLGGAAINERAPEGPPVRRLTISRGELVQSVVAEVERLQSEFAIPLSHVMVLTRHREERDQLISSAGSIQFSDWENRSEESVLCLTIHRAKGLERLAVILVDLDDESLNDLDYVGASRAMLHLTEVRSS